MKRSQLEPRRLAWENRQLKSRLDGLIEEARRNQATLKRFQSLELQLLGCRGMREIMQTLRTHCARKRGWDAVSLTVVDRDGELSALLRLHDPDTPPIPGLLLTQDQASVDARYPTCWLGQFNTARHQDLFPDAGVALGSLAMIPMRRHNRRLGALNIASTDPARFHQDIGTDFLDHLAAVLAVCVENVIFQERLKHTGLTDALTGVSNRRYFDQRLGEEVAQSLRAGTPLSCLLVDLDHFKRVNDTFGHPFGDRVLEHTAHIIRAQSRSHDTVARYGGEEFVLLLSDTGNETAMRVAERIRKSIEDTCLETPGGEPHRITTSIGLATMIPSEGDNATLAGALVSEADKALYRAKACGRNCVQSAGGFGQSSPGG